MAVQLTRRRFTVAEYYRMAQAGILGEDERVELIDGEIVQMTPIGPGHMGNVNRFHTRFVLDFGDVAVISGQNPVHLDEYHEPQPDLALLHPRSDFYTSALPTPEDVFLLVEVADTSIDYDRHVKMPLYARFAIPEVWLLDLRQQAISVYRDPTPDGYRAVRVVRRGERLAPLAFPDRELAVDDLLG